MFFNSEAGSFKNCQLSLHLHHHHHHHHHISLFGVEKPAISSISLISEVGCSMAEVGGEWPRRVEIRSSTGMGSTNTPTNSARNRQVNAVQISNEERTPDLIGMQNPVALNMMWNNVVQNPRDVNQNISTSGVHGFNFDTHNKLGNGGIGQYRGLVCNSTPYENSTGMVNSPVIQTVNPTLGMQLPMGLQNASSNTLNSSSMPPLMGMQNQVAVHNLSGMQNFLGLSMNGNVGLQTVGEGTNRHVFPGLYLNGHAHVLNAKSNHIPGSSGIDGRSNKRGDTVHGMDILELNT